MKTSISLRLHRGLPLCEALLAVLLLTVVSAHAQSFQVSPVSIASGGGVSTGGQFGVIGTIGQAQTGRAAGGSFTVESGFAALITALQTPGAPYLQLIRNGTTVTLAWDAAVPGFMLENVGSFSGTPAWQPVASTPLLNNGTNSVTLNLTPGAQFFRLRKP